MEMVKLKNGVRTDGRTGKAEVGGARMNRYYDALNDTAARMVELAKKLDGPKVRELTPAEKQLIRLAVLPQVREQLDATLHDFTVGKEVLPGEGPLDEFLKTAHDLKE